MANKAAIADHIVYATVGNVERRADMLVANT